MATSADPFTDFELYYALTPREEWIVRASQNGKSIQHLADHYAVGRARIYALRKKALQKLERVRVVSWQG
jgi:DNA-directed RNA polymerase sigma subunit (sigma70/sigma32)